VLGNNNDDDDDDDGQLSVALSRTIDVHQLPMGHYSPQTTWKNKDRIFADEFVLGSQTRI
jgi:hypothetical protein